MHRQRGPPSLRARSNQRLQLDRLACACWPLRPRVASCHPLPVFHFHFHFHHLHTLISAIRVAPNGQPSNCLPLRVLQRCAHQRPVSAAGTAEGEEHSTNISALMRTPLLNLSPWFHVIIRVLSAAGPWSSRLVGRCHQRMLHAPSYKGGCPSPEEHTENTIACCRLRFPLLAFFS